MSSHFFINPATLSVRENNAADEPSRIIEGCAIVFNQETILWDGEYERIREKIAPSCISKEFLDTQDVKLNLLHDRSMTLARCNKGSGSLQLEIRKDGLYFTAEMPKCDLGDQTLELIKNGTYTGCSFEFYPLEWDETVVNDAETGKSDTLITHTKFEAVTALTIAMDPAYPQTTIDLREQAKKREMEKDTQMLAPAAATCIKPLRYHSRLQ